MYAARDGAATILSALSSRSANIAESETKRNEMKRNETKRNEMVGRNSRAAAPTAPRQSSGTAVVGVP